MKKIVDDRGNVVHGMMRGDHGEIVVNNPSGLNAYRSQKNIHSRLDGLEESVSKMNDLMTQLLNHIGKQDK